MTAAPEEGDDGFKEVAAEVKQYLAKRASALQGEQDDCASPLDPLELQRFGYTGLIGKLMDYGGYIAVSERMNIPVAPPTDLKIVDPRDPVDINVRWTKPEQPPAAGSLAIGSSLEDRLEAAANLSSKEERMAMAFRQQAKEAQLTDSELGAEQPAGAEPLLMPTGGEVLTKRGTPKWLEAEMERRAALPPPQPFVLSLVERFYIVTAAFAFAISTGKSTAEAIDLGMSSQVLEAAQAAALALGVMSVASTVVCSILAQKKNRSVPLWAVKGLLCGVASLYEVQRLEPLPVREES